MRGFTSRPSLANSSASWFPKIWNRISQHICCVPCEGGPGVPSGALHLWQHSPCILQALPGHAPPHLRTPDGMTVDGALRVVLLVVGAVVALSFTRLSAARAPRPRPHDAPPAPAPRALRRFEPRLPLPPTLLGGRRQWAEGDPAAPFPWNQTHVHEALDPRSPLDDGPLKCDLWNNITPRLLVRTNPEVISTAPGQVHTRVLGRAGGGEGGQQGPNLGLRMANLGLEASQG